MADGAVGFVLGKVSDILQEEAQLLTGVRQDVQYISDELEFMKAFLLADVKRDSDPVLAIWVKQVREIANDIENALDEFRLRFLHDHGHGVYGSIQKLFCYVNTLRARRQFAFRLQDIKTRVVSVSEGYRRYCVKQKPKEAALDSGSHSITWLDSQGDALLLEEADLVGIDKPKNQLIGWLLGDKTEREVISVVGMGGLGKTTLVKKVFDAADVKKQFFRAWITVSQSFKTDDLLKDILHQLYRVRKKPIPPGVESMNNDMLRGRIKKILQHKKYLIILDDLWHIDAWDVVKLALPNNNLGSRVLLTTRNTDVAQTCCIESPDNVYPLNPLSPEESWTLFCKKIFHQDFCPPHLKEVSESILRRCEGLPLAIVAISGVLATKDKSSTEAWQMVCRRLGAELEENDKLKNMTKILSLSYDDLPSNLKSCLLYFSVFPEDQVIERMRLVRLWIAEEFVKEKDGKTLEEVADDCFNELLNRSLIQIAESTTYGLVKTCRIHDLLREIIISKSKEENFVTIAKKQMMIFPEKARRVSVQNALQTIQQICNLSQLRSLLMFWGLDTPEYSKFKMPSCGSRLISVLDLQGAPLKEFPHEILKLRLLRYLSLKNTKVNSVPRSIKKLKKLETLDMRHCYISELPAEILKLQKLRHLLVYRYEIESDAHIHTKYGFKALKRMGLLQSLQKLCFVDATHGGKRLMEELGSLKQLRRLGIVKLRKADGKALCASIGKLRNLRAISVTSVDENEIIDMEFLTCSPQLLQRIYLTGRLQQLPEWIPSLDSLQKIVLKWSQLTVDPLLSLQHLPNLVHLEFVQVYDGEALCFQAEGFQKLKFLGLNKLDKLKSITVERGGLPCLEKLIIECCKLLHKAPSGIEHLTKLKVLELVNMPDDLIATLRPESEDYQKFKHLLEVYWCYKVNGNWDVYWMEGLKDEEFFIRPDSFNRKHEQHFWK